MPTKSDSSIAAHRAARDAALVYTTDSVPGIQRIRNGKGFVYQNSKGRRIRSAATLARIHHLVIPPAWSDIWICTAATGHLQATGRDARGRKQYLYHPRWRSIRDCKKFDRMAAFGRALPRIRRRVTHDLRQAGITRTKVLATVVRLLEESLIRVGNDEYARANNSFGLTTFKNRHAQVSGSMVRFQFRGKSGKAHAIAISDKKVAKIVKRCQELPGHNLFEYLDEDGQPRGIHSGQVNEYLHEITGEEFTAKDFRTWAGTLSAAKLLSRSESITQSKLAAAVKDVAKQLGNTPMVCRNSYIHPMLLSTAEKNRFRELFQYKHPNGHGKYGLRQDEVALLRLLKAYRAPSTNGEQSNRRRTMTP
ncbi:MAG TPA: hypothetical protein VFE46_11150 [Pirellulales bacterium]|jgi:DNA topoisomerase-1|nr:hypothetical protein [Pirellulales bacterium]